MKKILYVVMFIWLFFGLFIMFSHTPTETVVGLEDGRVISYDRQRTWTDNFPGFLVMFAAPVGVLYGIGYLIQRNKEK